MPAKGLGNGFAGTAVLMVLTAVLVAACVQASGPSEAPSSGAATSAASVTTPQTTATRPAPKTTYAETAMPTTSYPTGVDPALEALLPSEVDGVRLFRWSIAGTWSGGSGDICMFFCPGEPQYFALALNRTTLDDTTVAVAAAANQPSFPVMFYAFKVPGARTEDLAPAWVTGVYRAVADPVGGNIPTPNPSAAPTPTREPLKTEQAVIGGKKVTILYDSFESLVSPKALQYLYARGDVLFMVMSRGIDMQGQDPFQFAIQDARNPPEAFVDSIAALP